MLPSLQVENAGFLLEGKNELGSGGGDPYMQLAAYYTNSVKGLIGVCKSASFLMEIYWNSSDNRPAMIKLVRTFKALKRALHEMKAYYLEHKKCLSPVEMAQLEFPEHHTFTNIAQMVQKLRYTKKLKDNVFHAVIEDGGQSIIVKFVQQYSTEAHKLCADTGTTAFGHQASHYVLLSGGYGGGM